MRSAAFAQAGRFVVVGSTNTLVSYIVFLAGLELLGRDELSSFLAQLASFGAGILWSFFWNSRWTFRQVDETRQRLIRFVLLQVTLMFVSASAIALVVGSWGISGSLGWLAVMVPITVVNFFATRRFVFAPIDPPISDRLSRRP